MLGSGNTKGFHRARWRKPHSEGTYFDSCDLIVLSTPRTLLDNDLKYITRTSSYYITLNHLTAFYDLSSGSTIQVESDLTLAHESVLAYDSNSVTLQTHLT